MKKKFAGPTRCLYCREIIDYSKRTHNGGIEFVNGYPTICRMDGKPVSIIEDEFPWMYREYLDYPYKMGDTLRVIAIRELNKISRNKIG